MLVCDYLVEILEGDYAHLRMLDENGNKKEGDLKCVARALLPENISEGSKLHYEMMEYAIVS